VRSGTGTAAALPGVQVAGKTGTAELVPTADGPSDPSNTTAWFVAFPAADPTVAVGVMLVGAGQGGASAAPIARAVLAAAL
jgi:cell division protein FtsI/penicillin-binding protein 2